MYMQIFQDIMERTEIKYKTLIAKQYERRKKAREKDSKNVRVNRKHKIWQR